MSSPQLIAAASCDATATVGAAFASFSFWLQELQGCDGHEAGSGSVSAAAGSLSAAGGLVSSLTRASLTAGTAAGLSALSSPLSENTVGGPSAVGLLLLLLLLLRLQLLLLLLALLPPLPQPEVLL